MHMLFHKLNKLLLVSAVTVLSVCGTLSVSARAFADDNTCMPPDSGQAGIHRPTGADAATFTYQCDGPYAGQWTNSYYAYNPATGARAPTYAPDYTYDCATGLWTMAEWDYSAASGKFFESRVVAPTAPNLPINCPTTHGAAPTADPSSNSSGDASGGAGIANTGPASTNGTSNNLTINANGTNNTQIGMQNAIGSTVTSGDTYVVGNTAAGSATSGDASAVANIANLLQSSSNTFDPNTTVFTANINGDVNGDFMFDPGAILAGGPGSSDSTANNLQVNLANTNNTGASINNNIDVGAASGNATVASNTTGGDATSGDATAVVNLMNLINSTVAAGHSFVGTININGDLNGDILLPPDVVNALLASQAVGNNSLASSGPDSANSIGNIVSANSTATNNTTMASTTNVNSTTTTGDATVTGNTTGGSATSGNSASHITLLNLTGSNVVGKDDLLVFVNVLGKWVGMIVNAPPGATTAELGGGITESGPNSSNNTANNADLNSSLTNNTNLAIVNNVNVHASSGDATVRDNTLGGNARSGDAHTAVNVLNLQGSNLSLSDWFGVLFINVFGIWNGSFGVNTSAGDPVAPPAGPSKPNVPTNNNVQAATHQAMLDSLGQLASFKPTGQSPPSGDAQAGTSDFKSASVLGSATEAEIANSHHRHVGKSHASFTIPLIGFILAILILVVGERDRIFKKK